MAPVINVINIDINFFLLNVPYINLSSKKIMPFTGNDLIIKQGNFFITKQAVSLNNLANNTKCAEYYQMRHNNVNCFNVIADIKSQIVKLDH